MQIERIEIGQVKPSPYNPRVDLQPGDKEYEALQASLDRWDVVQPLVWNRRTGFLVAGHQRLKLLQARGDTHIDVSVVDLGEQDERALNLALNKISGEWDKGKLYDVLQGLQIDAAFDFSGFNLGDMALLSTELVSPASLPMEPPPLYAPEVAPTISVERVTARDISSAETASSRRFENAAQSHIDILCPHCGKEFAVAGQFAEKMSKSR